MSDFFEQPPPPPIPEPEPEPEPAWLAAPRHTLPGVVALEMILARSERAAVAITRLGAYPTGFELDLLVLVNRRGEERELDPMLFGHHLRHRRRGRDAGVPVDDQLRFGVQFADGSKATNLDPWDFARDEPAPPVLRTGGGGGGGDHWRQDIWIWPLPPPGQLSFVCEWPAAGIELTRVDIEGQLVLEAAARSIKIFDESAGGGGSNSVTSRGVVSQRLRPGGSRPG